MRWYRIYWDIGYGESSDIIEAEDANEAERIAYEQAKDEFENTANYWSEELTEDICEEEGLDPADYGLDEEGSR